MRISECGLEMAWSIEHGAWGLSLEVGGRRSEDPSEIVLTQFHRASRGQTTDDRRQRAARRHGDAERRELEV